MGNMNMKIDMVIHREFGGFSLTPEMVDRLRERDCSWITQCASTLGTSPRWYVDSDHEFRRDPLFVEVVRELEARVKHEGEALTSWQERRALEIQLLNGLRVVTVTIEIEVIDHDGMESVRVIGGVW